MRRFKRPPLKKKRPRSHAASIAYEALLPFGDQGRYLQDSLAHLTIQSRGIESRDTILFENPGRPGATGTTYPQTSIAILAMRQRHDQGLYSQPCSRLFRLVFVFRKNIRRSLNTKCHENKTKLLCNCHEASILPLVEPGAAKQEQLSGREAEGRFFRKNRFGSIT